jgi:3-hydroxybutyryl-CoA dehydrogenase
VPLDAGAQVGVLGAGAMGAGIAQVAATNGHTVIVADADPAATLRARETLEKAIAREVEKGRLDAGRGRDILGRISYIAGADAERPDTFGGCSIVIEAIVERLDVKRAVFARLDAAVPTECVLATNTSSLPIAGIAAACTHSERVVGVHFFNPAPIMPLVEIIPWIGTSPGITTGVRAFIDRWGKTTVIATDTPGFIVNRVARPFYGEALRIHDEGIADPATIDWAMRELGGFRMGPFELMDLIGHDVNFAVTSSVFAGFFYDRRYTPSITQQRLVDAGMLGRKTGRGFYDYRPSATKPAPSTDPTLGRAIFVRILVMLINEAVDAVHWRVGSAQDIDLAVQKGVNYPKGLLAWGAELGWPQVLARLTALHEEYNEERYRPSVLLKRLSRGAARLW